MAKKIAFEAHKNQFRRDGVTPYFSHVEAVAKTLEDEGASDEVVAAGVLHDYLEDRPDYSCFTLRDLGIPNKVIAAVIVLTKVDGEPYEDYLAQVKGNEIARQVKIADMKHNLSDQPTPKQIEKYTKGLKFLLDV